MSEEEDSMKTDPGTSALEAQFIIPEIDIAAAKAELDRIFENFDELLERMDETQQITQEDLLAEIGF